MTSVDSEKAFEYLKIQEGSRSENLTGIIYVKEYFLFFSILKDIQARNKKNHSIS